MYHVEIVEKFEWMVSPLSALVGSAGCSSSNSSSCSSSSIGTDGIPPVVMT
jgi:hypothetical protein